MRRITIIRFLGGVIVIAATLYTALAVRAGLEVAATVGALTLLGGVLIILTPK